uniref:Uncharacterized protein n=1 Tax=Octopus bimaculoides TaxID=37653 RepID=A0A0L8GZ63_OCTBM
MHFSVCSKYLTHSYLSPPSLLYFHILPPPSPTPHTSNFTGSFILPPAPSPSTSRAIINH